jgi:hypothetical protein
MIARIYENVEKTVLQKNKKTIKKERKIKKKVESWEEKYIEQTPQEGYCGRCNRSYKFGDNPREPDKCPKCVCIDCKGSIMERRKTSTYGGSINRCYSDWYRYQYGKNYYGYKTGWEIDYNHRIPKKLPPILKKVPVEKEVDVIEFYDEEIEVEEQVKITINQIIQPPNIPYSYQNKIMTKEFEGYQQFIESYLSLDKYFKNADLAKYQKWYGSKSHEHVINLLNISNDAKIVKVSSLPALEYNQMIIAEKQMLEEFPSVVGFYPNVPAYIQGHPLNMYNNKRINKVEIEKSINLYFNATMDSKCFEKQYYHRGIICFSMIEYLMKENIKVNLKIIDTSFVEGETYIQTISFDHHTIKEDSKTVYNFLTVSAVLRVMMLEFKASMVKNGKLDRKWLNGFGYFISDDIVTKIMNLNDNDILFGTPDDLNILGYDLDDDFSNCMDKLGLGNVYESLSELNDVYESNYDNQLSIKDFIYKRGITKLIHFTSSENLDSIKKLGIMPRKSLDNLNTSFDYNDDKRLDGSLDAICLSVSTPNQHLLEEFMSRYPDKQYVVLEINPAVLYEVTQDSKPIKKIFFDYNAASRFAKKSTTSMSIMFKKEIKKRHIVHNRIGKKDDIPTSDQAEILFFGTIPHKYVTNIVFQTPKQSL